jgi:hypothetical protein
MFICVNKLAMKKIRLLQIMVYIAFTDFFIQDAAPDAYKGFMEGPGLSKGYKETPGKVTSLIPLVYINGASFTKFKGNQLKSNDNYSLENISINADLKVKKKLLWLSFCIAILVCCILYLILKPHA